MRWTPFLFVSLLLVVGCDSPSGRGKTAMEIYQESLREKPVAKSDLKSLGIPVFPGSHAVGSPTNIAGALNAAFVAEKPVEVVREFYARSIKGTTTRQGELILIKGKNGQGRMVYVMLREVNGETEISVNVFEPGSEPPADEPTPKESEKNLSGPIGS